jgi:hypothetical protein
LRAVVVSTIAVDVGHGGNGQDEVQERLCLVLLIKEILSICNIIKRKCKCGYSVNIMIEYGYLGID